MSLSRISVAAALLALSAFVVSPAMAGDGKNGGGGGTGGGGGSKNGGGGGCGGNCGGGGGWEYHTRIICVVNGRRFEANDVRNCYPKRKYYGYAHYELKGYCHHATGYRHVEACGCSDGAGYGGGYSYSYGGSVAARMQAERRARSFAYTDGGVYAEGGDGYVEAGAYGYEGGSYGMTQHHGKKWRRHHDYTEQYSYNPGYVIHYGPTIAKDGGY
jgi:hypothetical protein